MKLHNILITGACLAAGLLWTSTTTATSCVQPIERATLMFVGSTLDGVEVEDGNPYDGFAVELDADVRGVCLTASVSGPTEGDHFASRCLGVAE